MHEMDVSIAEGDRRMRSMRIRTNGDTNMNNTLAILNGRVGVLMAELERADNTEEREIIAAELEAAQEALVEA